MTNTNKYKNAVVQGDDNITFESRPEFGIEKTIEETKKQPENINIKIIPLPEYCVLTPTKETYDQLMRIYEQANWKWAGGKKPTEFGMWHQFEKDTHIASTLKSTKQKGRICCGGRVSMGFYKTIALKEFLIAQNIGPQLLQAINEKYDKK